MQKKPKQKNPASTTRYVISDKEGRELGEAEGKDKVEAVIHLHAMDPTAPRLGRAAAGKLVRERQVHFERVA